MVLPFIALLGLAAFAAPVSQQGLPHLQEEHFELTEGDEPAGLACFRRSGEGDRAQLELELVFDSEPVDVYSTERHRYGEVEHVWREVRHGAGRTLLVGLPEPGSSTGALREWGGPECRRTKLEAAGPIEFLPGILERARAGRVGPVERFDPLTRTLQSCTLVLVSPIRDSDGERELRLLRSDGSRILAMTFRGEALVGLAWGRAGLRGRRIEPSEFQERRAALLRARRQQPQESALPVREIEASSGP